MSDETPPTPPSSTPPPPPAGGGGGAAPPPPGNPPPSAGPGSGSSDRQLMIVLAYFWILVLIPYLTQKHDEEVQWHSRQGLVLTVVELAIQIGLFVLGFLPFVGCITWILSIFVFLGFLVLRVMAAVKGAQGERWAIPFVSDYTSMVPR